MVKADALFRVNWPMILVTGGQNLRLFYYGFICGPVSRVGLFLPRQGSTYFNLKFEI